MEYYTAKHVANFLGIHTTTLRKYALMLEQNNYPIKRDYAKNRLFTQEDIGMIQELQAAKENENTTLFTAARILTEEYRSEASFDDEGKVAIDLEEIEFLKREFQSVKQELQNEKLENAKLYHKIEFLVSYIHGSDLHKKELYDMAADDYVDRKIADMAL